MNFLVSMHYSHPHIGGMESLAEKQLTSLSSYGNVVTLLTCRHERRLALFEKRKTHNVRRYRSLNLIEKRFGVTYPLLSPTYFLDILRRAKMADIVHVHDVFYELSHLTGLAAILCRKPLFITQHVAMVDHPNKVVMFVQRATYMTIGKLLFNHAHNITVYNSNVQDFLLNLGIDESKIHLQYNGIDTSFFVPASKKKKNELKIKYGLNPNIPIALFVGRLVPKKGFSALANARSNDFKTLIIGNGNVPKKLQGLTNVRFYGPAVGDELLELYQLSDVFVFPAIGEMLTLVMQEAMACGLPIVTTDDPGYKKYDIDRSKILFVPQDPNLIKKAIENILSDDELKATMSVYSRQLVKQRFSWSKNYVSEYERYKSKLPS